MGIFKDLLYSKDNKHLDISRLMVGISVLAFWGGVLWHLHDSGEFDPVAVGTGIAAVFAGGGGWIFARQKYEEKSNEASN